MTLSSEQRVVIVDRGASDPIAKCIHCDWNVLGDPSDSRWVRAEARHHVAETGHRVAFSVQQHIQFGPPR